MRYELLCRLPLLDLLALNSLLWHAGRSEYPRASIAGIDVSTECGRAVVHLREGTAQIAVEYQVPTLFIESSNTQKHELVAAACEREIAYMRAVLHDLTIKLLNRVPPSVGVASFLRDVPIWDEERNWSLSPELLSIQPQHTTIHSDVRFDGNLPEGDIIRGAFHNLIADREVAIESMYRQIESDLPKRR
jgi:hypothetical protein